MAEHVGTTRIWGLAARLVGLVMGFGELGLGVWLWGLAARLVCLGLGSELGLEMN